MYMHTYMYVHICVYRYKYIYIYTHIHTYIYMYCNVCIHIHICIYIYIYTYTYIYIRIYIYMCICIYTYIYLWWMSSKTLTNHSAFRREPGSDHKDEPRATRGEENNISICTLPRAAMTTLREASRGFETPAPTLSEATGEGIFGLAHTSMYLDMGVDTQIEILRIVIWKTDPTTSPAPRAPSTQMFCERCIDASRPISYMYMYVYIYIYI